MAIIKGCSDARYEATTAIRNMETLLLDWNISIIAVTADVMETTKEGFRKLA